MKQREKSPDLPLTGLVFRLIGKQYWHDSILPAQLKLLGARIVRKDNPKTTHLVTIGTPIEPFAPLDGTMFRDDFDAYVTARSAIEKANPALVCMSADDLSEFVIGTKRTLSAVKAAAAQCLIEARVDTLKVGGLPGFVGM